MTIEEKIAEIRQWNRYHNDYRITLTFHDIYGTMSIRIYHNGDMLAGDWGNTLEKRLDYVLKWIASQ